MLSIQPNSWPSPSPLATNSKRNPPHTLISPNHFPKTLLKPSASLLKQNLTSTSILNHNSEIRRFCDNGNLHKAMELLSTSEKTDLDVQTYCSILQLCAEFKSLEHGKKCHEIVFSNGVKIEGILGTRFVFMYVSCGELELGRRVFDEVANEKVFLWNLMMNEYCKKGDFNESLRLFWEMQKFGVEQNSHTFTCVLKCLGALGCVEGGEIIHARIVKLSFGCQNTVANSLIAFYFKCGRTECAERVFDGLVNRDVISWNSMISGYVSNDVSEKGVEMFKEMMCLGVGIDLATVINVLVACANCGDSLNLGRAIHGCAIKACYDRETVVQNTLLDMYSKCGDLECADRVFEKMGDRSIVSWTSMIAGYAREGLSDRAVKLFYEMDSRGIRPDIYTVTSVLHACALDGSLKNGKDVHNYIKENGLLSNLSVSNTLIDMYAKCGRMEDAEAVFNLIEKRDTVSWNSMIGGYTKNCLANEAFDMFIAMQQELKPNSTTISCILPACASLAALDRGREIHSHALRKGYSSDRHVANALVDVYVKCGVLVLARTLFDAIPEKDLVSWTVMIAGYGMHGHGSEAIAAFNEMRQAGFKPDEVSFISVLYACSHSGLVEEGWRFFNIMQHDLKIKPKLEHYACIVDMLARAGKLSRAYKFIRTMPINPDATVWGALLCGCRIHHDVKLAEKVAESVFELEPENTGYYVLLANIYAEAEKWEEVKKLRERISRRGLRKNPGCSWIEVRGKTQLFVAGSSSHPRAKEIEILLRELRSNMKDKGYLPKTKYALVDGDEMGKEAALCGHSEKLAVALGILSLPPGKTIRVTKNLRVCGDCHEMAKFMSRMNREIVLRDSNRFHHFKNGTCSCRGYW